jgi:SAM-dependent methyltransferase
MHWKLKAHTLALLSRAPAGKALYHRLQRCLGTNPPQVQQNIARAAEIVDLIREAGHDPHRGVYMEIGTGWRPFVPFILHLIGAQRIITFDINPWLTKAYAFETCKVLQEHLLAISHRLHVDPQLLQHRYRVATGKGKDLLSLLNGFGVDYRYPGDAQATGLPDNSIDYVCSSNVLEHIPPTVLARIHRESLRVLRTGGLSVHRFNPQDHYCGVDCSITGANFLRYSQRAWRWYGGTGLAYHNRLRCCQHAALFMETGFDIQISRVRMDQRALDAMQQHKLPIHSDFAAFTPAELAADYMWLAARKA